jgi:ketosteroid isomerase-like protein
MKTVRRLTCLLVLTGFLANVASLPAQAADAAVEIRSALNEWMVDFNARRPDKICDLFGTDLRADFRGQPERDYDGLCNLLKRSLADTEKTFSYALDINEIATFGDVAVVRLVWTLTVRQKDGGETKSVEPGMDVLQKQADGKWTIIRYTAYEQ